MSQNNSTESSATKRSSLKSYASRVFLESSVGLVSSVAQTISKRRKFFKLLALMVCLTGFFYQSAQYLLHVLEYPTAVNIEVQKTNTFDVPSYTFCDNNRINRRLFCKKFPDRCEEPDEAFFRKYPYYFGENKSLKPKEEYYKIHDAHNNITDLTVQLDRFVTYFDFNGENITGPYARVKPLDVVYPCYSINDRVNNAESALTFTLHKFIRILGLPLKRLQFRVSPEEVFLPGNRAGIYFSLHSPFETENPFETGVFMRPGRTYMIYVSMEEEILQKSPYDTDCVNYTELWEENGRSGPRSKNACQQKCLAESSMICYDCVLPIFHYPGLGKVCEDKQVFGGTCRETGNGCYENCKDDCRKTTFRFKVQDRFSGYYDETKEKFLDHKNYIDVEIYIRGDGVLLYKHSPKYMAVEAFSCIGGFIGIWLGISLLDITDVFEGIVRIFHYSLKKTRLTRATIITSKSEKNTRFEENLSC